MRGAQGSWGFNDFVTLFKITGIVVIIIAAATVGRGSLSNFATVSPVFHRLSATGKLSAFGTSLIFVMFCYSGWNAAAYVAAEMKQPEKNLPRSLLLGTGIVLLLYLGLNAVYFYGGSVEDLAGKVEVGLAASTRLFGSRGAGLVTTVLCISILASASAMTIAGPRVYYAVGRDFRPFRFLAMTVPRTGAPFRALLLQGIVTSIIVLSGRVDQIQQYAGFLLVLFGSLSVSCVIVLRRRRPEMKRPFLAWGYPLTPVLFLSVSGGMMFWAFWGRPVESLLSILTLALGGVIYLIVRRRS
jgi:APA family basic amino acid/polyamine antiporter